ncbi:CvpA family protein [Terriglobus aquaticus]|uniref:CvpA family protein n=1 Tax=Terriglobus aquaticus TaxID=940139 RepID=A0ABW9KJH9_9BACT|nr:CvpA family protein [Terriglobus aquaticus]
MLQLHHAVDPVAPTTFGGLNALDWALIVLVGVSTAMAFVRGLIRSLISALGVLLGIVLAAWYAPALADILQQWIRQPQLAEIVAFLLILTGTYVVAALMGRVLRGAAKAVGLGFFDRLGGAAFGFARAVLVLAVALIPAAPFFSALPFARNSILLPYLQTAAHGVSFVMPQDFGRRLLSGSVRRGGAAAKRGFATQTTVEGEAQ